MILVIARTLDIVQDSLFSTWDAVIWEKANSIVKLFRFYHYWLVSLAGKIEVEGEEVVLSFINEYYGYPPSEKEVNER